MLSHVKEFETNDDVIKWFLSALGAVAHRAIEECKIFESGSIISEEEKRIFSERIKNIREMARVEARQIIHTGKFLDWEIEFNKKRKEDNKAKGVQNQGEDVPVRYGLSDLEKETLHEALVPKICEVYIRKYILCRQQ